MKTSVLSLTEKVVKYQTVELQLDGNITVIVSYVDGEITAQEWCMDGGFGNFYKKAYQPNTMRFAYYEDCDWLDSELCTNTGDSTWYDEIPKPTLITDWDTFKGFDNVICQRVSMDGNLYRLGDRTPIAVWRRQDYIGGFTSKTYRNLSEFQNELASLPFIRNTELLDIPYYNGGGRGLEFEYKLSHKLWSNHWDIVNTQVARIAKKYKKPDEY